jgi:hypothetical protein
MNSIFKAKISATERTHNILFPMEGAVETIPILNKTNNNTKINSNNSQQGEGEVLAKNYTTIFQMLEME